MILWWRYQLLSTMKLSHFTYATDNLCNLNVGQSKSSQVKSKEVYWNTLTFEYIRLHISMSKAHMRKTHTYGNKPTWIVVIADITNVPGTGKHPVPISKIGIQHINVFSKYVSQRGRKNYLAYGTPINVCETEWNTLMVFRCDFSSKNHHQCKCT